MQTQVGAYLRPEFSFRVSLELKKSNRKQYLSELVNERNLNGLLQVRIRQFIEPIFRNVTAAHGCVCARMTKLVEHVYIRPETLFVVIDERSENVDASLERYGEWDVVEYAEAQ